MRAIHYLLAAGAALLLVATLIVGRATPPAERPIFLVDQGQELNGGVRVIDGVSKRVMPPWRARIALPLRTIPPKPLLRFWMGLLPTEEPARIRFTVSVRRGEAPPAAVYTRELSASGWEDGELDLADVELEGASLFFEKEVVAGRADQLAHAAWGNPTLLPRPPRRAMSVLLISLDTLRADHLGVDGYARAHTPTLDALARDNVWYARSYSASLWTYPSHASLLYGLYPASLPSPSVAAGYEADPSRPRPKPLPELFRDAGYVTAGFTGGGFLSDKWAFPVGFNTYFMFQQPSTDTRTCDPKRFDGPLTFGKAREWLRRQGSNPFFLFVHTYDAHDRCPVWPKDLPWYEPFPDPGPAGRDRVIAYYDRLIARVDGLVGGLLEELETQELADRTIVVVTADHGEALWGHGAFGHGCALPPYDGVSRVPLIVRAPGVATRGRVDQVVSAVDVAPTLLALAGLPRPADMQGYPLPGLGLDGRRDSLPVYVHCGDKLAVRLGDHKLITDRQSPSSAALYNLERDAAETIDVMAEESRAGALLRQYAVEYWRRGAGDSSAQGGDTTDLGEATRERLRALGYLQ